VESSSVFGRSLKHCAHAVRAFVCGSLALGTVAGALAVASPTVLANATVPTGTYTYIVEQGDSAYTYSLNISSYDAGSGDLSGIAYDYYTSSLTGTVSGSDVNITESCGCDPDWTKTLTGTIDDSGVMTGSWTDGYDVSGDWWAIPAAESEPEGVYEDVGSEDGDSFSHTVYITSFDSGTGDFTGIGTSPFMEIAGSLDGSAITSLTESY
jgi:hypothetical protein